jgi:hypothetical protein
MPNDRDRIEPDPSAGNAERDEVASALVDGEATVEEQALLAADPALAARVEALRAAAARAAAPVAPVPGPVRESAIRAALAAYDGERRAVATTELDAARERRATSAGWARGRGVRVLSIAAAVLLALVAVPLLLTRGGDDAGNFTASGAATSGADEAADGGDLSPADQPGSSDAGAPDSGEGRSADGLAAADPVSLGSAATVDDLVALVAGRLDGTSTSGAAPEADVRATRCAASVAPDATPVLRAVADLDGRAVEVHVLANGDATEVVVADAATCRVVARRVL